ncbi:hypothetical protein [Actinoplanes sp. NPDC051851]|uniref:hypothetical protein n=1 Tax=Actinoplanes sp. NPDC051851 TaxID=3154753 RepID=UPI00342087F8
MTPPGTGVDWRRRLDEAGSRMMAVVGDWLAPRDRPERSEPGMSTLVAMVALGGGLIPILVMAVTWATRPEAGARGAACRAQSGYVLADRPAEAGYQPTDQCNSAGSANTVERRETGRYVVRFAGLGVSGGTAEVTPATGDDRICTLPDWQADGPDEIVQVDCFDRSGARADSGFAARFVHLDGDPGAYLLSGDPGRASQTVADDYSYNSAGGTNSVDREDVGSYVAYFGRQESVLDDAVGGTVKVSAVGESAAVCGVERWYPYPDGRYLGVRVRCRDTGGRPVDTRFAVTFSARLGSTPDDPVQGAYLWADRASEARYTPRETYQFNAKGAANTVTRDAVGEYRVRLPGFAAESGGQVQLTAFDSPASCVVAEVARHADFHEVRVLCRAPSGAPADTPFTLQFWQ